MSEDTKRMTVCTSLDIYKVPKSKSQVHIIVREHWSRRWLGRFGRPILLDHMQASPPDDVSGTPNLYVIVTVSFSSVVIIFSCGSYTENFGD